MIVRGSTADMALDIGIAVASGAAAALSVLGENTSSMVGVAISASLLPPAVNAGFLWSVALTCSYLDESICALIDKGKIAIMNDKRKVSTATLQSLNTKFIQSYFNQ